MSVPELAAISHNLAALRVRLTEEDFDPAEAGRLLRTLAGQVRTVATSPFGLPAAVPLTQLSLLLDAGGSVLEGQGAGYGDRRSLLLRGPRETTRLYARRRVSLALRAEARGFARDRSKARPSSPSRAPGTSSPRSPPVGSSRGGNLLLSAEIWSNTSGCVYFGRRPRHLLGGGALRRGAPLAIA